jgi:RNA 2',3'-cyclic 3'-phosphodiesterase
MEKVRIFVAVELTQEIKENLRVIQEELKKASADVKWVKPENTHLTLKFLGYVFSQQIPEIINGLKNGLMGFGSFPVEIINIGSFPEKGRPRIIWAGVGAGKQDLIRLQGKVEDFLKKFTFSEEVREYVPHLTIGRARGLQNIKALQDLSIAKNSVHFGKVFAEDVSIIRSDLKPDGPVYTILERIKL